MAPVVVLGAPPATRTFPFGNRTAEACHRGSRIDPVKFQAPVDGSNSSALVRKPLGPKPPAARTFPLGNRVAVGDWRFALIEPLTCQRPAIGSKTSEGPIKSK